MYTCTYQLDHSVLILGYNAVILPFNLDISSFLSTSLHDKDDDNQRSIKSAMNPLTSLSAIFSLPDDDDYQITMRSATEFSMHVICMYVSYTDPNIDRHE
jgi:hypothetical protein